jgi:hypothetical protein
MAMSRKLAVARRLAEQHRLSLFPMKFEDGRKVPTLKGWPEKATTDPEQLAKWFGSGDRNIGVATGASGLVVFDTDQKGVDGDANLRALLGAAAHILDETFTVESPTGSRHYYFRGDLVRNSVGKLARGVDIRSQGGYVVAPGSVSDKGTYRVINNVDIAQLPQVLIDAIAKAYVQAERVELSAIVDLDTPAAQASAIAYLSTAEPSIEGQGGNDNAYRVACRLKDLGVGEDLALDCMDLYSNWNERCVPPWERDELAEVIEHAYQYGENSPGSASVELEFDEIPDEAWPPVDEPGKSRFAALAISIGDEDIGESDPLIEGIVDRGTFVLVTGPQKTGKTFNVLDMCAHIATGRQWCDRDVARGVTIHFLGEGGGGVRRRLKALRQAKAVPADAPMYVVPVAVNLFKSPADAKAVIAYARELAAKHRLPVQAIIFDTLARSMVGGDESTVKDITIVTERIDLIRAATGATVFVVTHTGWSDQTRSRGSTALPGNIDAEFLLGDGTITFQNFREYEMPDPIGYTLESVDLGVDSKGRPVSSAVVRYGQVVKDKKQKTISRGARVALNILNDLGSTGVDISAWRAKLREPITGVSSADDPESRRRAVTRAIETLQDNGLIEIVAGKVSAAGAIEEFGEELFPNSS